MKTKNEMMNNADNPLYHDTWQLTLPVGPMERLQVHYGVAENILEK